MTISSTVRTAGPYSGAGVASPLPFGFKVFQDTDILVQITRSDGSAEVLTLGTDYSVTLNGDQDANPGGWVSLVTPLANDGSSVQITSNVQPLQPQSITNQGGFYPKVIEGALDRLTILLQQQSYSAGVSQALRVPEFGVVQPLPSATDRANLLLGFDATGRPTVFAPASGSASDLAANLASTASSTKGAGQVGFSSALNYPAGTVGRWMTDLAGPSGAGQVGILSGYASAIARLLQGKLDEICSVTDFMTAAQIADARSSTPSIDCTVAINKALAAAQHVVVPSGVKPVISSTINVPAGSRLEFQGGLGNTAGQLPASYFIKKSTATGPGITVSERGWVTGGGIVCQGGNTGDGIQLLANSATVSYFLVHGAGGNGVRVGQDGGANTNSWLLDHVTSQYNTGKGFWVHDGKTGVGADANAGTLRQCFSHHNGGDGYTLGHCFWVILDNCLSENNGGWGLYLSGANDGLGYPECRYATVIGGDYNETNAAGVINDLSYRSVFINPDPNNIPTNAGGALPGSGQRAIYGPFNSRWYGGTTYTLQGTIPFTVDDGSDGALTYAQVLKKTTTAGNGQGTGYRVDINDGTLRTGAGGWNVQQIGAGKYGTVLLGYNGTSSIQIALADGANNAFRPAAHNTYLCGISGSAWSGGYTQVAFTVVSDLRAKQDIEPLDDAERRVATALKGIVKKFRLKDSVRQKGDAARIHVGVIAQEVVQVFAAEGLDAHEYALLCYDEWEESPEVRDGDGNVIQEYRAAGNSYGIRYEELLAFILSAI